MSVGAVDERVGAYRLVRELGRGGMGEVWLGEHAEIRSRVAIKLIEVDEGQPEVLDRFLREAKATARIHHPGVVKVIDVGKRDRGAYLVMELLDGESLAQRLARETPALEATLEIAHQIVDALAAAHATGVVHRDLKPANVFLVRDPAARGGARVKLLDFGVAKATKVTDQLSLTITGALVGTPMYMSPEQCTSRFGAVDARADLYALGVMLFELVTGRPPFLGPTLGDLIDQHINMPPPPLRTTEPRLAELVAGLLAKRREDRPASAAVVLAALTVIRDGSTGASAALEATMASGPRAAVLAGTSGATLATGARGVQPATSGTDATLASGARTGAPVAGSDVAHEATMASGPRAAPSVKAIAAPPDSRLEQTSAAPADEHARAVPAGTVQPAPRAVAGKRRWLIAGAVVTVTAIAAVAWFVAQRGPGAAAVGSKRETAIATLTDECGGGEGAACTELGRRELLAPKPDFSRAFTWSTTACEAGDVDGCVLLGDLYVGGLGVKIDSRRSAMLFQLGCNVGVPRACAQLAGQQRTGQGMAPDVVSARTNAEHACALGDANGCSIVGSIVGTELDAKDDAIAPWYKRALELAETGCKAGVAEDCAVQSYVLSSKWGGFDAPRSFVASVRACDLGEALGCTQMGASHLGGAGIPRDLVKGRAILENACDRGDSMGCFLFAQMLQGGEGGPVDVDRARTIYTELCNQRGDVLCVGLALTYARGIGVAVDTEQARRLFHRACNAGSGKGCIALAQFVPENERAPISARACDVGEAMGCDRLGIDASNAGDHAAAARSFQRACGMSSGISGCSRLGELYVRGLGVTKDQARGIALFEHACKVNDIAGCHRYAMRLVEGRDVPANPRRGVELLEKACSDGFAQSCAQVADLFAAGKAAPQDPKQAAAYRERACKLSPKLCAPGAGAGSGSGSK